MKKRVTSAGSNDVTLSDTPPSGVTASGAVDPKTPVPANLAAIVEPGTVLGGRYEILEMLGLGGMGAVYQARDREFDRVIALKIIRPDLGGIPEIAQRFKQEIILARQITHKNVVRIFDLAEADKMKFVTMEYVPGKDLRTLLWERGKLPVAEAVNIIQQVCRGLQAAHAEGVVHRDLKPGNVMRDDQGRIVVMDFGLAHSAESKGITRTGALLGTMEYMSPEQAKAEAVDSRSDLFAVGLIFYELITGKMPYEADSSVASLLRRTQEVATPPSEVDAEIPHAISNVVLKCLERDPNQRYQNAQEILLDLDSVSGRTRERSSTSHAAVLPRRTKIWAAIAVATVVIAIASGAGIWKWKQLPKPTNKAVSVLVADFKNETTDPIFDGTLEPAFNLALEGAPFISGYSRNQAHRIAAQLQAGTTVVDEAAARLVATREGINVVVAGSVRPDANGFLISVKAVDSATGTVLVSKDAPAADKSGVLKTVGSLATEIRDALGDSTPKSQQIAQAETFSSSSLEGAHEYALAQQLQGGGKSQEAITHYLRATELDPDLGRAYAGLATISASIGRRQDAEKYYQLAMARIDRMTEREKYRTRGGYYLFKRDPQKAMEEYNALVKQFPFDEAGRANVAFSYFYLRDMSRALDEGRRALEVSTRQLIARHNLALYAVYASDFDTAIKESRAVIEENPDFANAYGALAMGLIGQGKVADAKETYRKLQSVSGGGSIAAIGLADLALYQGQAQEAISILEKAVATDVANKDEAAAIKLAALAQAYWLAGRKPQAITAADRASAMNKEESILFAAGRIYLETGQTAKALTLASQLDSRIEVEPQIYGKLLEGEASLKGGNAKRAIALFQQAQKLADTWTGRFDLGRAYLEAGMFAEADSEFEKCLKRRGEAAALFLDDVPTFRLLPPLYYYLGRAQEGLHSPAASESYKTFLSIKAKGDEDRLIADARRRLTP